MAKKKRKSSSSGIHLKKFALVPLNIILGVICAIFTFYLTREALKYGTNLISIEMLALLAGLILESYRISKNWETLLLKIFSSYLLSFVAFAQGKHEYNYNFANHIGQWPFYLIIIFIIMTVFSNREKVTAKLTEGITLLLSISAIYWTFDSGLISGKSTWELILISLLGLFTLVSILHAFSNIKLSKGSRLFLSIWSTIILFSITCENMIHIFNNESIADSNLTDGISIGFQYFMLGISSVYIMQNFLLLYEFLPQKNERYCVTLRENVKHHVERFSDKQVSIKDSGSCLIYTVFFYTLNYFMNLLPRNTMIWLVVISFPIVLEIYKQLIYKKKYG